MFDLQRLLLPVAFLMSLPGCDEDPAPNVEFRDGKNQCAYLAGSTNVFKFGGNGHGPPIWVPDGDPWVPINELPEDFVAAVQQDFQQQAEAVAGAMFASSRDAQESCEAACKEIEGRWTGGGCVSEGSFRFGQIDYAEPTYRELPRYAMEVDAEVALGCSCAVN